MSDPDDVDDVEPVDPGRQMMELLPSGKMSHEAMRAVHSELMINDILPGLALHEPTALLLDVNNLFRRAKENGFKLDYIRLKTIFEQRCDLRYCAAFSAVDRSDPGANEWSHWMAKMGYLFIGKDLLTYTGQDGRRVSKGNMDIEIACEALSLSPAFTHVIVGTCDGDFVPLVKKLQEGHIRKVSVLGISGHNWSGMSRALAKEADNFYDLSRLQEQISYRGSPYAS